MHVMFVHGMGRTPISGLPILWKLKRHGISTSTFGYSTTLQQFDTIRDRLVQKIILLSQQGNYALVGHSLGGVLIRSALSKLTPSTNPPTHVFLLGSPVVPARMAIKLQHRLLYRTITRDCGQLLASRKRMQSIPQIYTDCTGIIGTKGLYGKHSPFQNEPNDGVVSATEASATWMSREIRIPIIHTLLPASSKVAAIILNTLSPDA
jgi:hypothetical protein